MKIIVMLDLDKSEQVSLRENSIERVLNNADAVADGVGDKSSLQADIYKLKPLVNRIWWACQNELFKAGKD